MLKFSKNLLTMTPTGTRTHSVLIFAPFYPPAYLGGGPIRTISAIAQGAPACYIPSVLTSDTDLGRKHPLPVPSGVWTEHEGVRTLYFSTRRFISLTKALNSGRKSRPGLLYLSSFFNAKFSILPQILCLTGFFRRPVVVIAPRGEFGPAALAIKPTRKAKFMTAYRRLRLDRHIIWHASSPREADDIRRALGREATVVIRGNDSLLPLHSIPPEMHRTRNIYLRAAFVGRISEVKGLLDLIKSLVNVQAAFQFDIYGPDEDARYAARCREAAVELPSHIRVNFCGAIDHAVVRPTLAEYDVMLFPTRGENFGHVIAEALSVSCPVICADVTPWTEVLEAGGGRVVRQNSEEAWAQEIQAYSSMTQSARLDARVRAGQAFNRWRELSQERHIFDIIMDHPASNSIAASRKRGLVR